MFDMQRPSDWLVFVAWLGLDGLFDGKIGRVINGMAPTAGAHAVN